MTKFGKKFTCWKCSTRFYDLNKPNPKCPKCGADPEDDPNKGVPMAAAPAFGDDAADDDVEDIADDAAEEEELEEEGAEEEAAGGEEDF